MVTSIRAELRYLHRAPRKVRAVADLIRGKRVPDAELILRFVPRHAALPLAKLLASAVANAKHNFGVTNSANLFVSEIRVDQGPSAKRMVPRAMGRGVILKKRMSHIRLVLLASDATAVRRSVPGIATTSAATDEGRKAEETRRAGSERESVPQSRMKPIRGFAKRVFQRKAI